MTIRKRNRRPDGTIHTEPRNAEVEGAIQPSEIECCPVVSGNDQPPAKAGEIEPEPGAEFAADKAKLSLLVVMGLRGWNQEQMAAFFGVTTRTIRNWKTKLRDLKLTLSETLDPNIEFSQTLCRFAAREADLLQLKQDAEAEGDLKTRLSCLKELRVLDEKRCQFLDRHRAFAGIQIGSANDQDRSALDAHHLLDLATSLFNFQDTPGNDAGGRED